MSPQRGLVGAASDRLASAARVVGRVLASARDVTCSWSSRARLIALALGVALSATVSVAPVVALTRPWVGPAPPGGGHDRVIDAIGRRLPSMLQPPGRTPSLQITDRSGTYRAHQGQLLQHKLTPDDEASGDGAQFGTSVAMSANGDVALVGGPDDHSTIVEVETDHGESNTPLSRGAAWIFVRTGAQWVEQEKIVPTDESLTAQVKSGVPSSDFGASVALSADGKTALIGGPADPDHGGAERGAAWIYTRTAGRWIEQQRIVPSDSTSGAGFGSSVALSANGSVALIGGPNDDSGGGATWVYARTEARWSEQQKIRPADETAGFAGSDQSAFGSSVALSGNGRIALIGGPGDGHAGPAGAGPGAAWIYAHTGTAWRERTKLVPSDESFASGFVGAQSIDFGASVALSQTGTVALIGGPDDGASGAKGAAWVYAQQVSRWSEQQKIVPADEPAGNLSDFGSSVALSAAGKVALIGGPAQDADNSGANAPGAAWVYALSGARWNEQTMTPPTDEAGHQANFGSAVALAAGGNVALIGGPNDRGGHGSAWVAVP